MPPHRSFLLAAFLAALPLAAVAEECPPGVSTDRFVTAKGKVLKLPRIGTMSCEEVAVTLATIDSTRYRENASRPPHKADTPLYCYENELAAFNFTVCIMGDEAKPGAAAPLRGKPESK